VFLLASTCRKILPNGNS